MRQNGYCPRGPFCAFAHVGSKFCSFFFADSALIIYGFGNKTLILSGIPSSEETMNSLLTVIQSGSQSQLGSQQYSECPVSEWNSGCNPSANATSSNGQVGS